MTYYISVSQCTLPCADPENFPGGGGPRNFSGESESIFLAILLCKLKKFYFTKGGGVRTPPPSSTSRSAHVLFSLLYLPLIQLITPLFFLISCFQYMYQSCSGIISHFFFAMYIYSIQSITHKKYFNTQSCNLKNSRWGV